jgi:site-specific recombinase XerD
MERRIGIASNRGPWNKGRLVGQKVPLKLRDIWAIRVRLQLSDRTRDLALFDLAIDSKLRACGLVKLRVRDVSHGERIAADFLFPSRMHKSPHLSSRQYARIVGGWVREIGLDPAAYGTHTMRRTKASLIYRRTKNLRAVQLLLGHTKLESTVRYLGIEVDDALEMAEQTEV